MFNELVLQDFHITWIDWLRPDNHQIKIEFWKLHWKKNRSQLVIIDIFFFIFFVQFIYKKKKEFLQLLYISSSSQVIVDSSIQSRINHNRWWWWWWWSLFIIFWMFWQNRKKINELSTDVMKSNYLPSPPQGFLSFFFFIFILQINQTV